MREREKMKIRVLRVPGGKSKPKSFQVFGSEICLLESSLECHVTKSTLLNVEVALKSVGFWYVLWRMLRFLRCFGLAYALIGKCFSADGSTLQCTSDPITPCLNAKALFGVCFPASFVPCDHSSVASVFQPLSFPDSSLHWLHPAVVAAGYHGVNCMTGHHSELLMLCRANRWMSWMWRITAHSLALDTAERCPGPA